MFCASSCHPSGIGESAPVRGTMCFKLPLLFPVSSVPEQSSGEQGDGKRSVVLAVVCQASGLYSTCVDQF